MNKVTLKRMSVLVAAVLTGAVFGTQPLHADDAVMSAAESISTQDFSDFVGIGGNEEAFATAAPATIDKASANFTGVWNGSLSYTGGSCGNSGSFPVAHYVQQQGKLVHLSVPAGYTYAGSANKKGFSVGARLYHTTLPCTLDLTIKYKVKGSKAKVNGSHVIRCSDGSSCNQNFKGQTRR